MYIYKFNQHHNIYSVQSWSVILQYTKMEISTTPGGTGANICTLLEKPVGFKCLASLLGVGWQPPGEKSRCSARPQTWQEAAWKPDLVHGQWMVFCKWHMMPLPKLYPMSFLIIELSILILTSYQFQDICYQNHNSRCFHFQGSYHVIPHNKYFSMSGSFGGDVHLTERRILTMICRVIGRRWHQMLKTKRNSGNG